MNTDKKAPEGTTQSNDNVSNNAHYKKDGSIVREDERDQNNSADDWNAEESRTGRHR